MYPLLLWLIAMSSKKNRMTRRIVTTTRIKQLMHRMQQRRREVDRSRCAVDESSPQAGVIAGVITSIVLFPLAK